MTQRGQPQQTAEAFLDLHACEPRADSRSDPRARDYTDIGLPPDLRQHLAQIRLLHVHGQSSVSNHNLKPRRAMPLPRVLSWQPCSLGPRPCAEDEEAE